MVTTRTAASVVTKCHSAASGRYIKPNVNNDSNEQANSDQRHNKGQSMKGGDTAMLRRPGDGKEVMDIDAVEQKTKNNNKEQASSKRAVFTGSNINDASRMISPAPVEAKDPATTTVATSTTEIAVSTSKLISKPFSMPEHLLTVNPHFRFQVRSENNQGKL
jgi:hypothetical protein